MAYSLYTLEHSNGDKPFLLQLENDGIMLLSIYSSFKNASNG